MSVIWKYDFAKELKISVPKLDELMKDLELDYETTVLDKRMLVVSEETQESIKEYIKTWKKPK